jgi:photosystem II stability/assembly factor-like uncharacterized protein
MKRLLLALTLFSTLALSAQEPAQPPAAGGGGANQDPFSQATFDDFRLRSVGPAVASGRVGSIAVHPDNKQTWYIGVSSGGVWKTTNAGITFTPVFQNEASYAIGTVVIDHKNPSTIWVGTGEANNQRAVGYGDGVYRSDDAGKTWKNLGLKTSEQIGRIVIDPRDSKVVFVAAYGSLWKEGGERGLYKTTDGGATWDKVLSISENTGISDVAIDPNNPDVMLAVAHQRRRHTWTLIHGGPESGLHKSTDGGKTWRRIRGGLPGGDLGRIVIDFSRAQKGLVYAKVETSENTAIYASLDSGDSWERRGNVNAQPMYYQNIHADPVNPNRLYVPTVQTLISEDGGRTYTDVGERNKHVDNHYVWIDPDDTDHLLEGCDGGLYETWDRGRIWRHFQNLPVSQFYNVEVDNASPIYNIYGGTQDNESLGGPSRSRGPDGATNNDWWIITGGDGFVARVDPNDPNIVYGESQYAGIVRLDRRTGERVNIRPVEGKEEDANKFNWETPFIISPHNTSRLYLGANRLYRSDDRGNSWKPVSPDLTRKTDRNLLPVMGKVQSPDAVAQHQSTATWGNISSVTESRKKEGMLIAGTDDGNVQVSLDGGANWRKSEHPPGLPDYNGYGVYVQRVYTSKSSEDVAYSLYENSKNGDFKPYIYKSTNRGASWTSIAGDLPQNGMTLAFAEDPVNPNLLFVGTEFGLYFTVDGGRKWIRLKNNLPTIPVRDLTIQERESDLVMATFGRGFYVLDNYAPLRNLTADVFQKDAQIFASRAAMIEVPDTSHTRGSQGEQFWTGENPPLGAVITYWIKTTPQSARQKRQEAGRGRGTPPPYPSQAELTAEADEEAPQTFLTITDSGGKVVRRLTVPGTRGIHRFAWDLRGVSATLPQQGGRGGGGGGFGGGGGGPFVAPGTYRASLSRRVGGTTTTLGDAQTITVSADPNATLTPAQRTAAEFTMA